MNTRGNNIRRLRFSNAKFYGRESECLQLIETLKTLDAPERIFIRGCSGVGKSRFVEEFHRRIVAGESYFLCGKSDEMDQDPHSTIIQALDSFCGQIMRLGSEEINRLRDRILLACGSDVSLLVDMVPKLGDIVGGHAENGQEMASGAAASSNRLNHVFQRFFENVCTPNRPVVLFMDDLQWLDPAALELLSSLLTNASITHLMFLGAFRQNEVNETHSLQNLFSNIEQVGKTYTTITLGTLSQADLCKLVADVLNLDQADCEPLVEVMFAKTLVNVFYSRTMLEAMVSKDILTYSYSNLRWYWDLERLKNEIGVSNNVVSLVKLNIRELSADQQEILISASFLPSTFRHRTLRMLLQVRGFQTKDEELLQQLNSLVLAGLLEETNRVGVHRFAHDHVQQAASRLIDKTQESRLNMLVVKTFAEIALKEEGEDWMLFAAVDRLKSIPADILDISLREQIELNYQAGKRAVNSSAFAAAANYFDSAITILETDDSFWIENYTLCHDLYRSGAESQFCIGGHAIAERYCNEAIARSKSEEDKLPIYDELAQGISLQQRHHEANGIYCNILKQVGHFPRGSWNPVAPMIGIIKITNRIKRMFDEQILDAPILEDKRKIFAIEAASRAMVECFQCENKHLMLLYVVMALEISFNDGVTDASVVMLGHYAMLAYNHLGEEKLGARVMQLAENLALRLNAKATMAFILFNRAGYFEAYDKPWRQILRMFNKSYETALSVGDMWMGLVSLAAHNVTAFASGLPLQPILDDFVLVRATILQYRLESVRALYVNIHEAMLVLSGGIEDAIKWANKILDQTRGRKLDPSQKNSTAWGFIMCSQIAYYFGDLQLAADNHKRFIPLVDVDKFYAKIIFSAFFQLMIATGLYRETGKSKRKYERSARQALKAMKGIIKTKGLNSVHKLILMEAEYKATFSKRSSMREIKDGFETAISSAARAGFMQDAALGNELAGTWFLRFGDIDWARYYLTRAANCYADWGAHAKAKQLRKLYPSYVEGQKVDTRGTKTSLGTRGGMIARVTNKLISGSFPGGAEDSADSQGGTWTGTSSRYRNGESSRH